MADNKETVEQACKRLKIEVSCAKIHYKTKKWIKEAICNILSLHSNEIEEDRERRDDIIHGMTAEMENVRGEIAAKDAEITKLRALVGELADDLENNQCQGCHGIGCSDCSRSHDIRALVAKARKVCM